MKPMEFHAGEHAVLLVHGLSSTPVEMQPLAKRLHKAGYSVRVPYFKGYSYEAGYDAHSVTAWRDWQNQVMLELRDMKRQYKTVAVGGLCMGAVLSLSVAIEASKEISGLSLLATTLYYDGWSIPWYRFLLPLGYYTPFRYWYAYREREPFGLKNEALRTWVAREMASKTSSIAGASKLTLPAIHEGELLIKHVRRNLHRVSAPTLLIHAEEDDVSTPRSAELVANTISSDKIQKIMLHNSYHMITLDNERERVADETISFFNGLTGNGTNSENQAPVVSSPRRLSLVRSA
ncbi:MAG: alpha/beta fold hydrolase [Nitrosomonadales bacterium]|nr:alpha/beta fold hydrolase [Nitrosomonadales bacterium]